MALNYDDVQMGLRVRLVDVSQNGSLEGAEGLEGVVVNKYVDASKQFLTVNWDKSHPIYVALPSSHPIRFMAHTVAYVQRFELVTQPEPVKAIALRKRPYTTEGKTIINDLLPKWVPLRQQAA